jgi:hypothetical protein
MMQAQEEFAEAIAALSHVMRNRHGAEEEALVELAQCEFALEQMRVFFDWGHQYRANLKKVEDMVDNHEGPPDFTD